MKAILKLGIFCRDIHIGKEITNRTKMLRRRKGFMEKHPAAMTGKLELDLFSLQGVIKSFGFEQDQKLHLVIFISMLTD